VSDLPFIAISWPSERLALALVAVVVPVIEEVFFRGFVYGAIERRSGELALLDFHWLVMRRGEAAVTDFVEEHALWLCPHEQLAATFEQAGFAVAMQADGERPLIVARRRA